MDDQNYPTFSYFLIVYIFCAVKDTVCLLQNLEFSIHEKKSVFIPTQMITFLGNVIDSVSMTVTLPKEKVDRIKDECLRLQKKNKTSIREVSRIIGILVSSFSAVNYGNLHYRILEKEKNYALKKSFGNYDAYINVTNNMKSELKWWSDNIQSKESN